MHNRYCGSFAIALVLQLILVCIASLHGASDIFNDVRLKILPNGLRVILDCAPASGLTAIVICVRSGSRDEPADAHGIAHLVEHLVFRRAQPSDTVQVQVESLGGIINAETSYDYTSFYAVVPSKYATRAIYLLHTALSTIALDTRTVEREKHVVKLELMQRSEDPLKLVKMLSQQALFGSHPYGHPVGGIEAFVGRLRASQARIFYREHYVVSNMSIICSGAFDVQSIMEAIRNSFGKLPISSKPTHPKGIPKRHQSPPPVMAELMKPFYAISLSFAGPGAEAPKELATMDIIATHLGDGPTAVLLRKLMASSDLPIVTFVVAFTPRVLESVLSINVLLSEPCFSDIEAKVLELVNALHEARMSEERLLQCRQLTELRFRQRANTPLGRARLLAEAEALGTYRFAQRYTDWLRSVTPADIAHVAGRYFRPENYAVALIRPKVTINRKPSLERQ